MDARRNSLRPAQTSKREEERRRRGTHERAREGGEGQRSGARWESVGSEEAKRDDESTVSASDAYRSGALVISQFAKQF